MRRDGWRHDAALQDVFTVHSSTRLLVLGMTAYVVVALWMGLLIAIAAPFELTERGRRFTARLLDWLDR